MTWIAATWASLPHVLQSLVLGNVIQWLFVATLRVARGRFQPIGPVLDRLGPRAVRDPAARRASAGCTVALAWFALSWIVGHEALRAKAWVVARLLHR